MDISEYYTSRGWIRNYVFIDPGLISNQSKRVGRAMPTSTASAAGTADGRGSRTQRRRSSQTGPGTGGGPSALSAPQTTRKRYFKVDRALRHDLWKDVAFQLDSAAKGAGAAGGGGGGGDGTSGAHGGSNVADESMDDETFVANLVKEHGGVDPRQAMARVRLSGMTYARVCVFACV